MANWMVRVKEPPKPSLVGRDSGTRRASRLGVQSDVGANFPSLRPRSVHTPRSCLYNPYGTFGAMVGVYRSGYDNRAWPPLGQARGLHPTYSFRSSITRPQHTLSTLRAFITSSYARLGSECLPNSLTWVSHPLGINIDFQ